MNLLTGKAKQDFEQWLKGNCETYGESMSMGFGCGCGNNFDYDDIYNELPEFAQASFISEWLDSIDLRIIINCQYRKDQWHCDIYTKDKKHSIMLVCQSRSEAIKVAILTANKLYNEIYTNNNG